MVKSAEGTASETASPLEQVQSGSPCRSVDDSNKGTYYVIVHSITLPGASVTMDGDADDEWVMGDVPLLGRGGYVVYFLTVAAGGAALYVVSSKRVKGVAASQAKVLLGRENMAKAETARKRRNARRRNLRVPRPSPRKRRSRRRRKTPALAGSIWMRLCPPRVLRLIEA